ncbi:hypothetical protein [Pseudobdellovibrio exovorus]|uniref:Lipoprotein n=1 Tax=Pseudobdellovibrio exovorus JSS TaxID=1184267 RepID=M4VBF3_9BACT|nr:hypothetical protein [Pseudobdellovibrio exovorus]AGH95815.1 hypothetical protein A11Q_1599 [Pseudobdellovibrio exovorus JSS]
MKALIKLTLAASVLSVAVGCASAKYKGYSDGNTFARTAAQQKGKTPKQVVESMGQPMGAYYTNSSKNEYLLYYPVGANEVGMTEVMFNKDIQCHWLMFEGSKKFVFDGEYHSKANQAENCYGDTIKARGLILSADLIQ